MQRFVARALFATTGLSVVSAIVFIGLSAVVQAAGNRSAGPDAWATLSGTKEGSHSLTHAFVPTVVNPDTAAFLPAVIYSAGGQYAEGTAVADVNGDRKLDLLVTSLCIDSNNCPNGGGEVSVLLGNGDGTFQKSVSYSTGGVDAQAVAVADVNGDSKLDVVVANRCSSPADCTGSLSVLLGNGDGTFGTAYAYLSGGQSSWSLVLADVNTDGFLDAVVSNVDSDNVSVFLNNGDGTFRVPFTYSAGGHAAWSVTVADVNLDGKPDISVVSLCLSALQCNGEGTVGVLLGNGDGTFQPVVNHDPGGDNSVSVATADINGDGKPDLIVANDCGSSPSCSDATLGVLLGNGDGTFQTAITYPAGLLFARSVAIADMNNDGKLDILIEGAASDVAMLLGDGAGGFQTATSYSTGADGAGSPQSLAVADVNGDGWPDLVASNFFSNAVGVLMNNMGPHSNTKTALHSTANPALVQQPVTYIARVTNQSGDVAAGTITFMSANRILATVTLRNKQATYTTNYGKPGSHSITAIYSGDADNNGSTSAVLTENVLGPSTTAVATSGSPSHAGQPVTFTATVTSSFGTIPDGESLTFFDGTTLLSTATLVGGTATYTTSSLTVGQHIIKAQYPGDVTFASSKGKVTQQVLP